MLTVLEAARIYKANGIPLRQFRADFIADLAQANAQKVRTPEAAFTRWAIDTAHEYGCASQDSFYSISRL